MKKYLVIAGNIGAGKSTLVRLLSERLGFHPYYEPAAENPFLKDFYEDMPRWAYSQRIFLIRAVRDEGSVQNIVEPIITAIRRKGRVRQVMKNHLRIDYIVETDHPKGMGKI
jgi:deoxyadenosine/deoxycytidine kinase